MQNSCKFSYLKEDLKYQSVMYILEIAFGRRCEVNDVKTGKSISHLTEVCKPQAKRVRFSHLSSFFNFNNNNPDLKFQNPGDLPGLKKNANFREFLVKYHP
jgi:hypothetical protein